MADVLTAEMSVYTMAEFQGSIVTLETAQSGAEIQNGSIIRCFFGIMLEREPASENDMQPTSCYSDVYRWERDVWSFGDTIINARF